MSRRDWSSIFHFNLPNKRIEAQWTTSETVQVPIRGRGRRGRGRGRGRARKRQRRHYAEDEAMEDVGEGEEAEEEEEFKWVTRDVIHRVAMRGIATRVLPGLFYQTYNFHESREPELRTASLRKEAGVDSKSLQRAAIGWMPPSSSSSSKSFNTTAMSAPGGSGGAMGSGGELASNMGMKLGTRVDHHVRQIIQRVAVGIGNGRRLPTGYSVDPTLEHLLKTLVWPPSGTAHRQLAHADPLAQSFLRQMLLKQYVPVAASVPVGHLGYRFGTMIDSIWVHTPSDEITLIELQIMRDNYYESENDWMKMPYQDKLNTPRNQKQLQLGWTLWLARQTFPNKRLNRAFVVRMDPLTPEPFKMYELEQWVIGEPHRVAYAEEKFTVIRNGLGVSDSFPWPFRFLHHRLRGNSSAGNMSNHAGVKRRHEPDEQDEKKEQQVEPEPESEPHEEVGEEVKETEAKSVPEPIVEEPDDDNSMALVPYNPAFARQQQERLQPAVFGASSRPGPQPSASSGPALRDARAPQDWSMRVAQLKASSVMNPAFMSVSFHRYSFVFGGVNVWSLT